ncbi:MAG: Gfo/Idh/MocA family oxidoreductase [Lachnospiraceae bacterium]
MFKAGIIGYGTIAPIHRAVLEGMEQVSLVAICDIDATKKELVGDIHFYTQIEEMLEKESLDCVHICLPHYLHVPVTILCASKGIDVFTEKPLGLNYAQCEELFGIEEKYGVKIGVCLQNRYNATSVALKEMVAKKCYGNLLGSKGSVTWCRKQGYYEVAPWRGQLAYAGGGVMPNQAIHTLDLLQYIGGDIAYLEGKIANFSLKKTEIEDSVMARLQYANSDASAIFMATIAHCRNTSVEMEFVFEKAVIQMRNSMLYKLDEETGEETFLCEDERLAGTKSYYGVNHRLAISDFYKALAEAGASYIHVEEAAVSIKLIDAIVASSKDDTVVIL